MASLEVTSLLEAEFQDAEAQAAEVRAGRNAGRTAVTAAAAAGVIAVLLLGRWAVAPLGTHARVSQATRLAEDEITCGLCLANIDKDRMCGAFYKVTNHKMSEQEGMGEVRASFWKGEQCFQLACMQTFDLPKFCTAELAKFASANGRDEPTPEDEEAQGKVSEGMAANETRLAEAEQCQGIGICQPCLRSSQCADNAKNPKNYCCPRLKKCIDITQRETSGCSGKPVCPGKCSERKSQQPKYPMDCGDKCPAWDPLNWVKCGADKAVADEGTGGDKAAGKVEVATGNDAKEAEQAVQVLGADQAQLAKEMQCRDFKSCEPCLVDKQCAGHKGNPKNIFCCPKQKKCVDVSKSATSDCDKAGDSACPKECSSSLPDYPFSCADKCPGWDPLHWVDCEGGGSGVPVNCKTCIARLDKAQMCGAVYDYGVAHKISRNKALKRIQKSYWKSKQCYRLKCVKYNDFCKAEVKRLYSAEQARDKAAEEKAAQDAVAKDLTAADRAKLAEAEQCQGVGICQPCLRSSQCANNTENPKNYCCPRLKKCIDATQRETSGCSGKPVCPGRCSERRSQQPKYPMDCGDKCPAWDPLNWVKCGVADAKPLKDHTADKGNFITCDNCKGNINKMQACQALLAGTTGAQDQAAASASIRAAFWKGKECFELPCMEKFDLPTFCKTELMEMQRNLGRCFFFCEEMKA